MPAAAPTLVKQRFRFVVQVGALDSLGLMRARFRSCSELSAESAKSEIFHGGSIIPYKAPGRITMSDVTLEAGATAEGRMFGWFAQATFARGVAAVDGFQYKRPVTIVEQDRAGGTLNRWHLANAFPVRFSAGEWDNESDDFTITSVVLTYDFFAPTSLTAVDGVNPFYDLLKEV